MSRLEVRSTQLFALLRQLEAEPAESAEQVAAREARVVDAMLASAAAPPRRRSRRGAAAAGVALALAAGVALFAWGPPEGAPVRQPHIASVTGSVTVRHHDGRLGAARAGQRLGVTDRIIVPSGADARLELPSGASARVGGRTELGVEGSGSELDERLTLARGTVALEVPALPADHSLAVTTPQATVTVVGTRFSVTVVPDFERTCVAVARGRVRVDSSGARRVLSANEQWSSDGNPCVPSAPAVPGSGAPANAPSAPLGAAQTMPSTAASALGSRVPTSGPEPTAGRDTTSPAARASAAATPAPAPSTAPTAAVTVSAHERQNRIFADAMAARRSGEPGRALALLDQLLTEYPNSPLAPQARRERQSILDGARR